MQEELPLPPHTLPRRHTHVEQDNLPTSLRRSSSVGLETPFEVHLQEIYTNSFDPPSGLAFFESHGYYDVYEANTVAMFRQNFGMETFWDGSELLEALGLADKEMEDISMSLSLTGHSILNVGSLVLKNTQRVVKHESIDEDGCSTVDLETEYERVRAERVKRQSCEVDEEDLNVLAKEQVVLETAITVIRTEKMRFRHYFYQAFQDQMERTSSTCTSIPIPEPLISITLPPFSGYLYLLKDTIPHVFRSWHKRWLYLDFTTGLILFYKRSYWKRERGILDLRTVATLERMHTADIRIECFDGRNKLLRSKIGSKEADLWWNLLQFARQHVNQRHSTYNTRSVLPIEQPTSGEEEGSVVVSTKRVGTLQNPNVLDLMSALCNASMRIVSNPAA